MLKILITGITGFLGSHIAERFCADDVEIIGLKRKTSSLDRCNTFSDKVTWIDLDGDENWKELVLKYRPSQIVHSAWIGVEAKDRDNWQIQAENITLMIDLLNLAKDLELNKFIFLGSQAEYGVVEGRISENQPSKSVNAYGAIKNASLEILRTFCEVNHINWIWLRVFSIFGERESNNWLIPSIITKMKSTLEMDFTPGKQKYAYLYTKDFSNIIYKIAKKSIDSGVYNLSSDHAHQLKELIEIIKEKVNPKFKLNFGAIPYRQNQSMHIEGDITKLLEQIGPYQFVDFNVALHSTIDHYISK